MIGVLLLILSLFLYVSGQKKWSVLLFLSFCWNGLGFLTSEIIGMKNQDLAFVYTIFVCIYSAISEKKCGVDDRYIRLLIIAFFLFLLCSILFSLVYYQFSPYQVLQASRAHFLFLSFFFLRKMKSDDIIWLFKILFYITILHGVLYIIQVLTNLPVLPYGKASEDGSVNILRYYNFPVMLGFYLFYAILYPHIFHLKNRYPIIIILFTAMICTLGRTYIISILFCLLLGLLLLRKFSSTVRTLIIIVMVFLPFSDIITSRYEHGGQTEDDIKEILTGGFMHNNISGTMSYRFAWVYERAHELSNRPLMENVFGLGFIKDSQKEIQRRYHFQIGRQRDDGTIIQLQTADIAYGNMLVQLGYVGGMLLLFIWIRLCVVFFRNKEKHPLFFCMALFLVYFFIDSFAGTRISETGHLTIPFLLLTLLRKYNNKDIQWYLQNNQNKILIGK